MPTIWIIILFLLSFSLSAQKLVEKDSTLYLVYENNTFPAKTYKTVKLYRYYLMDNVYFSDKDLLFNELFKKANWNDSLQKTFINIYEKEVKKFKKDLDYPKKLFKGDSLIILRTTCEKMFHSVGLNQYTLRDSLLLSGENLKNVLNCFVNEGPYTEYGPTRCGYIWRHQIAFFDEKGKECGRIKICLSCRQVEGLRLNNVYDAVDELRKQLKAMGVKMTEFGYQEWKDKDE